MASTACCRSLCANPALNRLHQQTADRRDCSADGGVVSARQFLGCPLNAPRFGALQKQWWEKRMLGRESRRQPMMMSATVAPVEPEEPKTEEPKTEAAVPIEKSESGRYPTVLDINQVKEILPHRYPFLLVDKIIEYEPGKTAVGLKNVTVNDQFFNGHFPQRPIMPGVLQVEALAQVGGIVLLSPEVGGDRENFFFAGVDNVRWRKPVVPGDTLLLRVTLTKLQKKFGIAKLEGKAYVNGEVVCEADLMLMIGK